MSKDKIETQNALDHENEGWLMRNISRSARLSDILCEGVPTRLPHLSYALSQRAERTTANYEKTKAAFDGSKY